MALQVWLPLRGDLKNLGLSNITVTNSGATVSNEGKIGKCYSFNGGSSSRISCSFITLTYPISICGWFNCTSYTSATQYWISYNTDSGGTVGHSIGIGMYTSLLSIWYAGLVVSLRAITTGLWYHITVTINNSKECKTYLNGELIDTRTFSSNQPASKWITIGARSSSTTGGIGGAQYFFNGKANDVRIYDHCLSPKEIKEISKGLVLHYKLDTNEFPLGNINLVKNGWGGTDNWIYNSSTTVSTNVPNVSGITNSYSNSNTTKEFIPIHSDHSYTISAYVKKYSQNYCYISIIPYDADYLRISNLYTPDGFKASSLTTLSQDLKNGDTVIHLTNLSNWANPTTYQYFIAIFGYKDSTGYVYPDLFYTRRVYSFGSTTDKSKLDIENNTVTLNSPYSGETIPSGTSACLAASGNTYYYPAYIAATSAEDWTFLTKTFIPKNINYLKPAKYAKIISMGNYLWLAGITLIDNTESSNIIHDYSGYLNDGTIIGNSSSNVSPRYSSAISMNNTGTTNHIETDTLSFSDNIMSVSFWVKSAKAANHVLFSYPGKIVVGQLNNLMCVLTTSSGMFNLSNFKNNDWNHIVAIRNVDSYQLFINGTEETRTTTNNYYVHNGNKVWLLNRNYNTSYAANAAISDIRVYSTALSEEDIKELYNTSAIIDNLGNTYSYLFEENNNNDVSKTGIVKFDFIELKLNLAAIYKLVNSNLLLGTTNGISKMTMTTSATEFGVRFNPTEQLLLNTYYTISMMIRGTAPMNLYTLNTGGNVSFHLATRQQLSSTEYTLQKCTFQVTGDRTINQIYICTKYGDTQTGEWFEVEPYSIKLEVGLGNTPWIPAITDTEIYRLFEKTLSSNQLIEI